MGRICRDVRRTLLDDHPRDGDCRLSSGKENAPTVSGHLPDKVVRGDWRPRLDHDVAQDATTRLVSELSRLGLLASAPLDVEKVPFVNGITSPERTSYDDASKDVQSKIDEEISERTRKLEQKIGEDIPSAVPMLGPAPIGPNKSTFYFDLDRELEGGWRWLVKGRPIWLLQRQAGDEGSMVLLEGDAPGGPKTGGRVVNLGRSLDSFWVGQHGATDHQTQFKPSICLDRYLVLASVAAANIAVYDLETDKVLRIFEDVPQPDLISDVVLSDDTRHLIQVCSDGQYFIFEVASGRQVLWGRMVDDEIIAYTPQGYYWSTYEGAHFVELRFPGLPGVFPFEQFAGFDGARAADTALAWREIASLLHAAKARVIVILDACHAGLSGAEGLGTNDEAVNALLSGEHPPMLVLAASKGRQLSFEGQNWDGGVFTYALIEALQAKRADYDVDRDGAIEVSELYRALRTILARETKGKQSPWLVRQDLLGDFVVF